MIKTFRGADPIPQILPRIGLGVPANGTKYETTALEWLKAVGINVVCHAFDSWLKRTSDMQYTIDISDVTASATNCIESGIRFIPGLRDIILTPIRPSSGENNDIENASPQSSSSSSLMNAAFKNVVDDLKNDLPCPCWYLPQSPKVGSLDQIEASCDNILGNDQWLRPVLFPLLSASSSISALGGSTAKGWTEANKFSRYCQNLKNASLPPIWWVTDSLYNRELSDDTLKTDFLTALKAINDIKDLREWYENPDLCIWVSVNCSASIPAAQSNVEVTDIPSATASKIGARMKLQAHIALAAGARGIVLSNLSGTSSSVWYPMNTVGVENPIYKQILYMNNGLNKVQEAFMGTTMMKCGIYNGSSELTNIMGGISFPLEQLSSISGATAPLFISRLVRGSMEYYVVVNMSLTDTQKLTIGFSDTMTNLNPLRLSISPTNSNANNRGNSVSQVAPSQNSDNIVDDKAGLPVFPPIGSEPESGKSFGVYISAGETRVFSRLLPLSDFGITE